MSKQTYRDWLNIAGRLSSIKPPGLRAKTSPFSSLLPIGRAGVATPPPSSCAPSPPRPSAPARGTCPPDLQERVRAWVAERDGGASSPQKEARDE